MMSAIFIPCVCVAMVIGDGVASADLVQQQFGQFFLNQFDQDELLAPPDDQLRGEEKPRAHGSCDLPRPSDASSEKVGECNRTK